MLTADQFDWVQCPLQLFWLFLFSVKGKKKKTRKIRKKAAEKKMQISPIIREVKHFAVCQSVAEKYCKIRQLVLEKFCEILQSVAREK